jgi:hypothetical protein
MAIAALTKAFAVTLPADADEEFPAVEPPAEGPEDSEDEET